MTPRQQRQDKLNHLLPMTDLSFRGFLPQLQAITPPMDDQAQASTIYPLPSMPLTERNLPHGLAPRSGGELRTLTNDRVSLYIIIYYLIQAATSHKTQPHYCIPNGSSQAIPGKHLSNQLNQRYLTFKHPVTPTPGCAQSAQQTIHSNLPGCAQSAQQNIRPYNPDRRCKDNLIF